jgi:hypothetical protein
MNVALSPAQLHLGHFSDALLVVAAGPRGSRSSHSNSRRVAPTVAALRYDQ